MFYASAAAAQEAGFRPCLRCRPETAPGLGAWRGSSNTVSRALSLIEEGALDESDVDSLAARLGVGERQLRRLFELHLGAPPIAVAQNAANPSGQAIDTRDAATYVRGRFGGRIWKHSEVQRDLPAPFSSLAK